VSPDQERSRARRALGGTGGPANRIRRQPTASIPARLATGRRSSAPDQQRAVFPESVGEFSAGLAAAEEAIEIANALDDPWSRASAYYGVGVVHLRRWDLAAARPRLEKGLELCRLFGIRSLKYPRVISAERR
jgi:hypothetical protein